ncbi:hypothetical protein CPB85DRAFT_228303 [Mucidula mucida]|nr:hypothetical protein CPB85DRAFT_228303 [Mucidula mucida]
MQVEEINEESLLVARPIFPIDVHYHLLSHQDTIISLVVQQGRIDADKIMLSSGFDKGMMACEDVAAQYAYVYCSDDIHLSTVKIDAFLLALGNILAPFAGVALSEDSLSSCSMGATNIDMPRDDDGGEGDGQAIRESRRNEGNGNIMESTASDGDGTNPGSPDSDSESEESADSSITVASDRSGPGQSDGGDPCVSGACARFDITFNIKPSLSSSNNHSLRMKGIVEAKKLGPKSHTFPDTIATSRLQFT